MSDVQQAVQQALKQGLFNSSVKSVGVATKIYLQARMLGFDPPDSVLGSLSEVQGKIVMEANLMLASVLRSGKCKYFVPVEVNQERAVYRTRRNEEGAEEAVREYTAEDAKLAGLLEKPVWKHRAALLAARCKATLLRDMYADIVLGCYTPDELEG